MIRSISMLVILLTAGCASAGTRLPIDQVGTDELFDRARDLLVRGTQSEDPLIRANAIEALARVAHRDGLPYIRTSLNDGAPVVRFAACVALGERRDEASKAQIKPLIKDPSEHVQLAAAFALYRLGDRQHAGMLVKTLTDHPKEDLRAEAANLIGKCGDRKAITRLELAERREKGPKAQLHISAAKARLGDKNGTDDLLRAALGTEAVGKVLAVQFLIELKPADARDVFIYRFKEEGDYLETRLLAARGLGELGDARGYDLAVKSLRHSAKEEVDTMRVRSLAAWALGAIGKREALPALQKLAADQSDARMQVAACTAICRILGD